MDYENTLEVITQIIAKIDANCGLPNDTTETWAYPKTTTNGYGCEVPKGSHGFTKEQMTNGIDEPEKDNVEYVMPM
jgi:hypothetical protein